jgi:hypothetical protein
MDSEEQCALINKKLDTLHEILTGNGTPSKGVIVRLDRVEQKTNAASWFIGVVIVALVGLYVGQINLVKLETNRATTDAK